MKARLAVFVCLALATTALAASAVPAPQQRSDPYAGEMTWREIGPVNMSGRVSDIEALDEEIEVTQNDMERADNSVLFVSLWPHDCRGKRSKPVAKK